MAKKKKLDAARIVPYKEAKKCGCLYCYDNERTKRFDPRKMMNEKELEEFNKKIGRKKNARYIFCPHKTCPYINEFENFDSYLKWIKEKSTDISFSHIFGDSISPFPPNATFAYSNKD